MLVMDTRLSGLKREPLQSWYSGGQNPLVGSEGDPSDATRMKEAQGLNEIFSFCLDQR